MKTTACINPLAPRTSHLEPQSGFTPRLSFCSKATESAPLSTESGFTLIELLIVMSIMLILMALAVPQMLKVKKNANQTSAVQTMRTIGSSEMSYFSSYPGKGFGCPLTVLGGDPKTGAPTADSAQLIDASLASSGHKSGYVFTVTCGSKTTVSNQDVYNSVEITGIPETVGKTGDNGYCSDENNVIRIDPTGGTNCTQQLQ